MNVLRVWDGSVRKHFEIYVTICRHVINQKNYVLYRGKKNICGDFNEQMYIPLSSDHLLLELLFEDLHSMTANCNGFHGKRLCITWMLVICNITYLLIERHTIWQYRPTSGMDVSILFQWKLIMNIKYCL